jgi:hypothetical protein
MAVSAMSPLNAHHQTTADPNQQSPEADDNRSSSLSDDRSEKLDTRHFSQRPLVYNRSTRLPETKLSRNKPLIQRKNPHVGMIRPSAIPKWIIIPEADPEEEQDLPDHEKYSAANLGLMPLRDLAQIMSRNLDDAVVNGSYGPSIPRGELLCLTKCCKDEGTAVTSSTARCSVSSD